MNISTPQTVLIGTFSDLFPAEGFVKDLRRAGFQDDQIGVVTPEKSPSATLMENTALAGALTGGTVGLFTGLALAGGLIPGVGPILAGGLLAASLGGAAAGATAGGLLGGLFALGIPEEEARAYEGHLRAGRTLVVVQAPGRIPEALAILRHWGEESAHALASPPHRELEVMQLDELPGKGP